MRLSSDLVDQFSREGYLFFPGLFSAREVGPLRRGLERLSSRRGPEVVCDPIPPSTVRIVFGVDVLDGAYRRLRSHPFLLTPAEQILGTKVCIYQARINFNRAFSGVGWGWHQDFNQWFRQDGLQKADALLVGVFLDEVNACNAPLMVIPGSHKRGHIYLPDRMEIDEAVVAEFVREGGIRPLIGCAGSVVLLHPLTVHGSTRNITPWPRSICYLSYNSVANTAILHPRGDFRCGTDFTPLPLLDAGCLAELADVEETR
jgi:ectoine hydroxylase